MPEENDVVNFRAAQTRHAEEIRSRRALERVTGLSYSTIRESLRRFDRAERELSKGLTQSDGPRIPKITFEFSRIGNTTKSVELNTSPIGPVNQGSGNAANLPLETTIVGVNGVPYYARVPMELGAPVT